MNRPSLHAIASALAAHGTTEISRGVLFFNGTDVAFVDGSRLVLSQVLRGLDRLMPAKTVRLGTAEQIAEEIRNRHGAWTAEGPGLAKCSTTTEESAKTA